MERIPVATAGGVVSVLRRASAGSRPPVVFIHGINGAGVQWSGVLERPWDRTLIAVDLRGHGESAQAPEYGLATYGSDVMAVLDYFGLGEVHLVGASFGGGVAVTVAARRPEVVRSVTVIGGAISIADTVDVEVVVGELHRRGSQGFFELLASGSFAPGADESMVRALVEVAAGRDVATIELVLRDAFAADIAADAVAVQVPGLVLTGQHDQTCPTELGRQLAEELWAHHEVLAGRGHMVHMEDPALVARLVGEHIDAVEANQRRLGE